jgi:hypothetical protein
LRASPGGNAIYVSSVSRSLYAPLSVASSVAGGLVAGRIFSQIWQRISRSEQEPPPDPKDLSTPARKAVTAAALQGLIFGMVRAAVDRAEARGYHAIADQPPTASSMGSMAPTHPA